MRYVGHWRGRVKKAQQSGEERRKQALYEEADRVWAFVMPICGLLGRNQAVSWFRESLS
jgi:hypothetical protein